MENKDDLRNLAQKLREKTGYGMMECKMALVKYNYDIEKAERWLEIKERWFEIKDQTVFHYRLDEKGNRVRVKKEI